MTELKPCPFCGGEAKMRWLKVPPPMPFVVCKSCGAESTVYRTEAEAISAWNTRAERTCEVDEVVDDNWEYRVWTFELSCCHDYESTQKKPPNYCPNCGAKVVY